MSGLRRIVLCVGFGVAATAGCQLWLVAQQPAVTKTNEPPRSDPSRFEFEVVQSFNAKYDGDTPGHIGRFGGLEMRRPRVALGDPVFRGEQQIGTVTGLGWSRAHGSLEVEFDPRGDVRICVGDLVWLALDGKPPAGPGKPAP